MPKKSAELMPLQVKRLAADGLHPVGGVAGLCLQVRGTARSWILRTTVGNRRREIGLGGYPDVELSAARTKAREMRDKIGCGVDPVEERKRARAALRAQNVLTFDEASRRYIAAKESEWRNPKHGAQWRNTLATYASPVLGRMPVEQVRLADVLSVLEPIWKDKTETAVRLRGRMEAVMDWAAVTMDRSGAPNPARWKGNLDKVLPLPNKVAKKSNQPALPIDDMPRFMTALRKRDGASRALELLILTAARSSEVRAARWSEIDMDARLWTIPGDRMKSGREHVVPLSDEALGVLDGLPKRAGSDLVFSALRGGELSDATLAKVIKLMHDADAKAGGRGYLDPKLQRVAVPHGFRSTFKDWASERSHYPNEVSEAALAHIVADKTEAAYRRGTMLEKRAAMMADWAQFIGTPRMATVIPIRRRA